MIPVVKETEESERTESAAGFPAEHAGVRDTGGLLERLDIRNHFWIAEGARRALLVEVVAAGAGAGVAGLATAADGAFVFGASVFAAAGAGLEAMGAAFGGGRRWKLFTRVIGPCNRWRDGSGLSCMLFARMSRSLSASR